MDYRPQPFKLLPDVVKNLLIINGLFFLATIVLDKKFGFDLTDLFGLHYYEADKFRPFQLITYMFMHGGWAHILFNMFALWMFGNSIENYWGAKRFLTYYIITGLGAAFTQYLVIYYQVQPNIDIMDAIIQNPSVPALEAFDVGKLIHLTPDFQERVYQFKSDYESLSVMDVAQAQQLISDFVQDCKAIYLNQQVIVGASGAVFGLLLAFGMMFPNQVVYIYFALPMKAKYFVMLYGVLELYSGLSNNSNDNVAHFAHLGGMLFGFLLIKFWKQKRIY